MIDRVLSDYIGTRVETQTISGVEWWLYNAWCAQCGAELARVEVSQALWEDAIHARSIVSHRILKEIERRACKCCNAYGPVVP